MLSSHMVVVMMLPWFPRLALSLLTLEPIGNLRDQLFRYAVDFLRDVMMMGTLWLLAALG